MMSHPQHLQLTAVSFSDKTVRLFDVCVSAVYLEIVKIRCFHTTHKQDTY